MGDPEPRDLKKPNLPILPVFYPFPVNPIEMGQKFQRHSTQRSKIHKKHLGFGQNSAKNFLPLFASADTLFLAAYGSEMRSPRHSNFT